MILSFSRTTGLCCRMFESYPSLKQAFGPFKSLNADDLRYSKVLADHGQRLLNTIAAVLETRDDPDAMVKHLHDLGQKHMTFDAKMAYMDVCSDVVNSYW